MRKWLLAIVLINVPLHVSKHFFRIESGADFGAVGGLDISPSTIAIVVLWLIAPVRTWNSNQAKRFRQIEAGVPVLLLLFFHTVSILGVSEIALGLFQVWALLQMALQYFYISHTVTSRDEVRFIVRFLLIGLIIEAILMLFQASGFVGNFLSWKMATEPLSGRLSGTMGSPNTAASYLAIIMGMASVLLIVRTRIKEHFLAATALLLAIAPLLLTLSRGGWVSFIVGPTIGVFCRRQASGLRSLGIVTGVFLLILPFAPTIRERLSSKEAHGAAQSRIPLNYIALSMIKDHPITGVGANQFPLVMRSYSALPGEWLYTVHNTYLLIGSETGIAGLLAFVWFLIATLRQGWHCYKRGDPLISAVSLACIAGLMGHIVHMWFDLFRYGAAQESQWILAGLIASMYRLTNRCKQA